MAGSRHITMPAGFRAAGVACGVKPSRRKDLAIIAADGDASVAIATTQNQVFGAPIQWCRTILPRGYGKARGIVINAGVSNVCTGSRGMRDARTMAAETAARLGTEPRKVLVASTGIIGHRLPMTKIKRGIAAAAGSLGTRNDSAALRAIMTTDTREKSAVVTTRLGGKAATVAGIVKGAGMIAPSLATMIGVITTDAAVAPSILKRALAAAVRPSFNAVTVDGDTSTSDIVAVFASGASGTRRLTSGSQDYRRFTGALAQVCMELARAVAADGEGATKLVEVAVRGARSDRDAEIAAKSVANSPLFKCAVHGCDPNWGRIACALGKSAAKLVPQKLSIAIGPTTVFRRGRPVPFSARRVANYLARKTVVVMCNLGVGEARFTAFTCDLTREYVAINSDYHT